MKKTNTDTVIEMRITNNLLDLYVSDLDKMSMHLFNVRWHHKQFGSTKQNFLPYEVLLIHGFTDNYTCQFNDKP